MHELGHTKLCKLYLNTKLIHYNFFFFFLWYTSAFVTKTDGELGLLRKMLYNWFRTICVDVDWTTIIMIYTAIVQSN